MQICLATRRHSGLWLALALFMAPAAQAQEARPASLAEVLRAAARNTDARLAEQAAVAARADIIAADHAPLPQLSGKFSQMDLQNGIGGGNLLRDKRIDKSIGIDWTYERGDKREWRTRTARLAAQAADADREETGQQQMQAALSAYMDLWAAQARLAEVRQIEGAAAELVRTASRRVAAGDLAPLDQRRAGIEAARAAGDTGAAELDRQRAALALALLIGQTHTLPSAQTEQAVPSDDTAPLLERLATPAALAQLAEDRPDVRGARERSAAAQAAFESAQALRRTDLTWGASFDHYPGTSTRQLELRLQMPLQGGLTYDYAGEIGRARAQLTQAETALEKTRMAAMLDLARLRDEALTSQARARLFATEIVPHARSVAESAELAYRKGAMDLTDLLDARRTLRATEIDGINARADQQRAFGALLLRLQPARLLGHDSAPTVSSVSP